MEGREGGGEEGRRWERAGMREERGKSGGKEAAACTQYGKMIRILTK